MPRALRDVTERLFWLEAPTHTRKALLGSKVRRSCVTDSVRRFSHELITERARRGYVSRWMRSKETLCAGSVPSCGTVFSLVTHECISKRRIRTHGSVSGTCADGLPVSAWFAPELIARIEREVRFRRHSRRARQPILGEGCESGDVDICCLLAQAAVRTHSCELHSSTVSHDTVRSKVYCSANRMTQKKKSWVPFFFRSRFVSFHFCGFVSFEQQLI